MKPVLWLDRAADDLYAIGDYIARDNPRAAREVLIRIKTVADSLSRNPEIGRRGRVEGTRELVLSDIPYLLAYQVTSEDVRILAVLHAARKWPDIF